MCSGRVTPNKSTMHLKFANLTKLTYLKNACLLSLLMIAVSKNISYLKITYLKFRMVMKRVFQEPDDTSTTHKESASRHPES